MELENKTKNKVNPDPDSPPTLTPALTIKKKEIENIKKELKKMEQEATKKDIK